jgi:hypothetical protein
MALISRRREVSRNIERAGKKALNDAALDLLSKSVPLAPLDEGDLRRSGNVEPASVKGDVIEARVGYATEYAVVQHEDLSLNHPEPGTQAKFLEQPARQNERRYQSFIADALRKAVK